MNLKDLNKEYDKLQKKYGAKELDSIYPEFKEEMNKKIKEGFNKK